MVSFYEELAVGVSFFVYREGVGSGSRRHSPEVDWASAYFYFSVASDGWDGAVEGLCDDFCGFLAGGY